MRYEDLTALVQHRARLSSRDAAEQATRATLETFAVRVPDSLTTAVTARLPHDLGDMVRRYRRAPLVATACVGSDDFVATVAERTLLDAPRAAAVARTVFGVLDRASDGALESARPGLAEDVRDLMIPAQRSARRTAAAAGVPG